MVPLLNYELVDYFQCNVLDGSMVMVGAVSDSVVKRERPQDEFGRGCHEKRSGRSLSKYIK